jgi:hypothetical protein
MQIKSAELAIERKRADLLLCQMLPREVAEALKLNKEVKAQQFDCVTVYFSDIVGFTEISARSSPMDIVQMLNSLYRLIEVYVTVGVVYFSAGYDAFSDRFYGAGRCKLSSLDLQLSWQGLISCRVPLCVW